jgi:Ser/Thr protein kinase RdoA (MazF antagonist)
MFWHGHSIMSAPGHEREADEVLDRYPTLLTSGPRVFLGNHGGFSGARLWRVESAAGPLCLRAWPEETMAERLILIHRAMRVAHECSLGFVPRVFSTCDGHTVVATTSRLWDLTAWMPGRADYHERPSAQRLAAACVALARLHLAWAPSFSYRAGPCLAVQRRLARAGEWLAVVHSNWRPSSDRLTSDPVRPWAERAWNALHGKIETLPEKLTDWIVCPVPLQLCLCDVWHAHVLFEGDTVSGLIDFGSIKIDHVAVDLARMLGSMAGDDASYWRIGIEAYRTVRPFSAEEEGLAKLLDQTGTLLAAANWLRWLYHDGRHFDDRAAVAERLAALVRRIEHWPGRPVT